MPLIIAARVTGDTIYYENDTLDGIIARWNIKGPAKH
jgi:hypothetical protein